MHFIPNEAWRLIHKVSALRKAILKVNFVAFSDGNSIRDDDHFSKNMPSAEEY